MKNKISFLLILATVFVNSTFAEIATYSNYQDPLQVAILAQDDFVKVCTKSKRFTVKKQQP